MTAQLALILIMLIPACAAVLIPFVGRWQNVRESVSIIAAVSLLAVVIWLVCYVGKSPDNRPELFLIQFAGSFELKLKLEPLGAIFAAIASSLWLVNTVFTIGYMRGNKEKNQTRFYTCVAIAIAAVMGIASAANLITLFVFYEILTLSTFPLVTHKGDAKAKKGGRIYLLVLMATSLGLLLPAVIVTHVLAGTTDFQVGGIFPAGFSTTAAGILLFLFAFGIGKAALMPIHPWLPNAMVAPTPVSALLHAVAVVKAGVFTMLKITVYIFGPDLMSKTPASTMLVWIAAISIVLASIIALRKDNLKARLAYSTISQLAYITLGAMLATSFAIVGGGIQIIMHAWGKITLFMCAGAIYTVARRTEISSFNGLGRTMPWVFGAFLVGSLSIIGIPPMGGSWPKFFLMAGALDAGQKFLLAVLILSSILNVAYLIPVAMRAFLLPPDDPISDAHVAKIMSQHRFVRFAPVFTATGAFALFFAIGPLVNYLKPILPVHMTGGL